MKCSFNASLLDMSWLYFIFRILRLCCLLPQNRKKTKELCCPLELWRLLETTIVLSTQTRIDLFNANTNTPQSNIESKN